MKGFRSVAAWVLQILLAALFAVQGIVKLAGSPAWIARFRAWGYPDHFYVLVGLAEVCGAVLLLVPKLSKFGVWLLLAVMAGATITHGLHGEKQVGTTLLLSALLALLWYLRRGPGISERAQVPAA